MRDSCSLQPELCFFLLVVLTLTELLCFHLVPVPKPVKGHSMAFLLLSREFLWLCSACQAAVRVTLVHKTQSSDTSLTWKRLCMSCPHLAVTTDRLPSVQAHDSPQVLCVISDNLSHSAASGAEAHGFQLGCAFVLVTPLSSRSTGWSGGGTRLPGARLCQTPVSAEGCASAVPMLWHEAQSACARRHQLAEASAGAWW